MRTTLNLDQDILELAKSYSKAHAIPIGKAVSELVRRGIGAPPKTRVVNGLVVFDLPEDTETVTSEHVRKLESERW